MHASLAALANPTAHVTLFLKAKSTLSTLISVQAVALARTVALLMLSLRNNSTAVAMHPHCNSFLYFVNNGRNIIAKINNFSVFEISY